MKTAIVGKVRIKAFWHCAYSGKGCQPFSRIGKIGPLLFYWVVKPDYAPFSAQYYKRDVMTLLAQEFNVRWEKTPIGNDFWHVVYSNIDGGYVGTPECAYRQYQRGLKLIQKANPSHKVCSIGYNSKEFKWYGWSHRAMCGFKIRDVVKEGDCCASSGWTEEYLKEHPEEDTSLPIGFTAVTEADTKRMACAFAESVS